MTDEEHFPNMLWCRVVLHLLCCNLCGFIFAIFASRVLPLNEQQFLKILQSVRNCWHVVDIQMDLYWKVEFAYSVFY